MCEHEQSTNIQVLCWKSVIRKKETKKHWERERGRKVHIISLVQWLFLHLISRFQYMNEAKKNVQNHNKTGFLFKIHRVNKLYSTNRLIYWIQYSFQIYWPFNFNTLCWNVHFSIHLPYTVFLLFFSHQTIKFIYTSDEYLLYFQMMQYCNSKSIGCHFKKK